MKTASTITAEGQLVEAVVGYRVWRMFGDSGCMFLNSVWHPAMWDDVTCELHSECNCWHTVQADECLPKVATLKVTPKLHRCGIHAWDRPRWSPNAHMGSDTVVAGEVRLWGEVHIHEHGYRAEHAKIAALFTGDYLSDTNRKRIEIASLTYDVPLVSLRREEVKL
jgi:hypothetical protein